MKKTITILLLIAMTCSLFACQKTPEEAIIIPKDSERMIEKASEQPGGSEITSLGIPQGNYSYDDTGADGKLRIHIDASVQVPDIATLPIMRATIATFTQEQVTCVFEYLFPDDKPISNIQVETKADIEQEIIRMKKQLAEENYPGFTQAQYEAMIAQMEDSYQAAPDAAPDKQVSDGTMKLFFDNQTQTPLFWTLSVANSAARFSVNTPADIAHIGSQSSGAFVGGASMDFKRTDIDYSRRNMVFTDGTGMPDKAKEKLKTSYIAATELCEEFLTVAGMQNEFCVGAAYIVDDSGADEAPGNHFAYRFSYTRKASNIPVFFDSTNSVLNQDKTFSLPWDYEIVEFIVDDNGFASITWRYPISIGEAVEQNATLRTFDEIKSVFEAMAKTSYEGIVRTTFGGECELDVNANDVRLCLMRIREQNAAQTDGLLVPAWVFYGQNKATGNDGTVKYLQGASVLVNYTPNYAAAESGAKADKLLMFPGCRESEAVVLLAINAIDGSIIDPSLGY